MFLAKPKRIMSIVLSMLFMVSILPAIPVFAGCTSDICGENVTYSFDQSTGTLTISGNGKMNDYSWDDIKNRPWDSYRSSIKSVTIENGVTSIGENAFFGCIGLTSITIPSSVTSIEEDAIASCINLTSIDIPASVTSIGTCAFNFCISLTSITIPSSVTSIGMGAFHDCSGLTSITIPGSVTSIGNHAFRDCRHLTSVTIENGVTSIGMEAFEDCESLTTVKYLGNTKPKFTSTVFRGCRNLNSVEVLDSYEGDKFCGIAVKHVITSGVV